MTAKLTDEWKPVSLIIGSDCKLKSEPTRVNIRIL